MLTIKKNQRLHLDSVLFEKFKQELLTQFEPSILEQTYLPKVFLAENRQTPASIEIEDKVSLPPEFVFDSTQAEPEGEDVNILSGVKLVNAEAKSEKQSEKKKSANTPDKSDASDEETTNKQADTTPTDTKEPLNTVEGLINQAWKYQITSEEDILDYFSCAFCSTDTNAEKLDLMKTILTNKELQGPAKIDFLKQLLDVQ